MKDKPEEFLIALGWQDQIKEEVLGAGIRISYCPCCGRENESSGREIGCESCGTTYTTTGMDA